MQLTVLEAAVLLALPCLAWSARGELRRLLRRPPLPLALLGAFALAHLLSAALAEPPRFLPFKAALRMVVCAAFACVTACLGPRQLRWSLRGLAWSTLVVAALAVVEGAGSRAVDPFLDSFREAAVFVGGTRRATAASEHSNLAAAFLVSGLVVWTGLAPSLGRLLPAVAVLSTGLLFTYSRGGLAAAVLALVVLLLARARVALTGRAVVAALGLLGAITGAFAWTSEAFRLRLRGESPETWFVARYQPAESRLLLAPGERVPLSVELANVGKARWNAASGMALGQHWFDVAARTLRTGPTTPLPQDILPGQRAAIQVPIVAPDALGRYVVMLDLTHDGHRWFSESGVRPSSVAVLVRAEDTADADDGARFPGPESLLPTYWQPTRADFTRLALAMWRDRPLTGVGSDNFRHLHARYAGRHLDIQSSAGNAFLETAATTGLIGLVALVGTLVASARAALSSLRSAPAGSESGAWASLLLALLAGLLVQDCVDYFIAATGHYLFFGLTVGAAASASMEGWS